jgi:hypothetical protein
MAVIAWMNAGIDTWQPFDRFAGGSNAEDIQSHDDLFTPSSSSVRP